MAQLETRDGVLDRFQHDGLLVYGCPPSPGPACIVLGTESIELDAGEVRLLIHALQCALVPYGEPDPVPVR